MVVSTEYSYTGNMSRNLTSIFHSVCFWTFRLEIHKKKKNDLASQVQNNAPFGAGPEKSTQCTLAFLHGGTGFGLWRNKLTTAQAPQQGQ